MSRDNTASEIGGLATAVITAYVRYVNEHRGMDNVSVLTASAFYLAVVVDTLSFNDGDPSREEVMTMIADGTMMMLEDTSVIREHMGKILKSVVGEGSH